MEGNDTRCSSINSTTEDSLHTAYAIAYREARSRLDMQYNSVDAQVLDLALLIHTLTTAHGYEVVRSGLLDSLSPSNTGSTIKSLLSRATSVDNPLLYNVPTVGYTLTAYGKEYVREFLSILKHCKEDMYLTIQQDKEDTLKRMRENANKKAAARMRKYRARKKNER